MITYDKYKYHIIFFTCFLCCINLYIKHMEVINKYVSYICNKMHL